MNVDSRIHTHSSLPTRLDRNTTVLSGHDQRHVHVSAAAMRDDEKVCACVAFKKVIFFLH